MPSSHSQAHDLFTLVSFAKPLRSDRTLNPESCWGTQQDCRLVLPFYHRDQAFSRTLETGPLFLKQRILILVRMATRHPNQKRLAFRQASRQRQFEVIEISNGLRRRK